jgi:hypothetical protein
MKTRILLTLAAMAASSVANASELPKGSLMCGDESSMKEAVRAVEERDAHWLESLPACLLTNQDLKAQVINCDGRACKIRFWVAGQTTIGYTLSHTIRY